MSKPGEKTLYVKLAELFYAWSEKNPQLFDKSLKFGDKLFESSDDISFERFLEDIKNFFSSDSKKDLNEVLTIKQGDDEVSFPLSRIDVIYDSVLNEKDESLNEDEQGLVDSIRGTLSSGNQNLEDYIYVKASQDEKKADKSSGNVLAKEKSAAPQKNEGLADETDYNLFDNTENFSDAIYGGHKEYYENNPNDVQPVNAPAQKTYIGFGGLTSAVKKRLGTDLETMNNGRSGFSKAMTNFVNRLKQLNDLTESLYPDKNGFCKEMTSEEAAALQAHYRELTRTAELMLRPGSKIYKDLNSTDKKYLKTVEGIRDVLRADDYALAPLDSNSLNRKYLPKVLWELRTKKMTIREQDVARVGGTMSTRLPLRIDGTESFVTPITNYEGDDAKDYREIRDRIIATDPLFKEHPNYAKILSNFNLDNPVDFIKVQLGEKDMNCLLRPKDLMDKLDEIIPIADPAFWIGPFHQLYEETSRVCRQNIEMRQVKATAGSTISRRSLGVSSIYKILGGENNSYIPKTGTVIINDKPYIYMAKGDGDDADRPVPGSNIDEWVKQSSNGNPPKISANAARQLMDSQVMDFISGNVDRHVKNFLYRFEKDESTGELILNGFDNIDNDMSFGTMSKKERDDIKKGIEGELETVEENGNKKKVFKAPNMGSQHYCPPEYFHYISKPVADKIRALVGNGGKDVPEALQNELAAQQLSKEEIDACWDRMKEIDTLLRKSELMEELLMVSPFDVDENWMEKNDRQRIEEFPEYADYLKELDKNSDAVFKVKIKDPEMRAKKIKELCRDENNPPKINLDGEEIILCEKDFNETLQVLTENEIKNIDWSKEAQRIGTDGKTPNHPEFNTNYFHRVKDAINQVKLRMREYSNTLGTDEEVEADWKKVLNKVKNTDTFIAANQQVKTMREADEVKKEYFDVTASKENFEAVRRYVMEESAKKRIISYTDVKVIDETKTPSDLGSISETLTRLKNRLDAKDPLLHRNSDEYKQMKRALDNTLAGLSQGDVNEEKMLGLFVGLRNATNNYIAKKGSGLRTFDFGTVRLDVAKQLNTIAQERVEMVQNRAYSQAEYMQRKCKDMASHVEAENPDFAIMLKVAEKGFASIKKGINGGLGTIVQNMRDNNSFVLDCMMTAAGIISDRQKNGDVPGDLENKFTSGIVDPKHFIRNLHKSQAMISSRKNMNEKDLFAMTALDRFEFLQDPKSVPELPSTWQKALIQSGKLKFKGEDLQKQELQQTVDARVV